MVSDVIPSELLGKAIELSYKRLVDLFEVRNALELTAAELAAAWANPDQLASLEETVYQLEELVRTCPEDRKRFRTIDLRFHLLVMKASGNDALVSTYNSFTRQIALAFDMVKLPDMEAHALPTQRSVILAIRQHSPLEARLAMSSHVYPLISIVQQFFEGRTSEETHLWIPTQEE